ncbi:MAG: hypothetical protein NTW49_03520 [Bacteroidia bacterium]|nr:hypothetical protein [Bacteroidia bacterium]
MTNKETVERNIGLTFDFLRQLLKEPTIFDKIPDRSVIEFIEKDFAKRVTKDSIKPNKYLKVKNQFELLENKREIAHLT